ncbi:hypothetical protein T07_7179 [Trichinella nelsoni]|uniref:Uncharacterized protein n=1 Tax=Trichinella nelsoni TaxID=6336 RepID=A0A0V0RK87_9BILA|nr:hypothetical protein T07_7179 [Trichinella nelsoni]
MFARRKSQLKNTHPPTVKNGSNISAIALESRTHGERLPRLNLARGRSHSKWSLESAAAFYMCSNKEMFHFMKTMKRTLIFVNNKSTDIKGTGAPNLEIPGSDGMRSGFQVIFQENSAIITNHNLGMVLVAYKDCDLYCVESPSFIAAIAESNVPPLME